MPDMCANRHAKSGCTATGSSAGAMAGFTLIEMLVVIAVLGVLMAIGAPSFNKLIRTEAIKSASFDVFSSLILARSEAITRNAPVEVKPTGGNWTNGWEVKDTVSGTVIRKQSAFSNNVAITGPASVTYNGTGRLTAALASGIGLVDSTGGFNTRCIIVDLSGRPVVKKEVCP